MCVSQIRSGFEAGLLTAADADFVKKAFTSSLDHLYVSAPIVDLPQPAAVAHSPTPAPAPVPADLQVAALEVTAPACIETGAWSVPHCLRILFRNHCTVKQRCRCRTGTVFVYAGLLFKLEQSKTRRTHYFEWECEFRVDFKRILTSV